MPEESILQKSKRTGQSDARMFFFYFACLLDFPTRETGAFPGIQQAAVTNAARKGRQIAVKDNIIVM